MAASQNELLRRAALEHGRALRRSGRVSSSDFQAVLDLGSTVLLHSIVEVSELHSFHELLDTSVRERLEADHTAIGEGLRLLEDLLASDPESPDLPLLSQALLQRMRQHLERDERVLYEPLRRLHVLSV